MHDRVMRATFERGIEECFGRDQDRIEHVDERALRFFTETPAIVWEGDAQTFQFSYVSRAAETLLGYPAQRWIHEPTFWADVVIEPDDRDDAIAYCALATAKRADHVFEYRAKSADGRVLWLRDYVRVIVGARGVAANLRGIMFDVSAQKYAAQTFEERPNYRVPSPDVLAAIA